jgi:hypothetical protein
MNILGVVAYGNLIEEKTVRCVEKFNKVRNKNMDFIKFFTR